MTNGAKTLLRCTGCNTSYNIANLKSGTKFKCQKCGTINVVPAQGVAAPPTAVSPSSQVKTQPPAKPTAAPVRLQTVTARQPTASPQRVQTAVTRPAAPPPPPPLEVAPSEEEAVEEQAPPVRPSRLGRPGGLGGKSAGSRFSKMSQLKPGGGKTSRFSRKGGATADEAGGEDKMLVEESKKKKKTWLIIGLAAAGAIILVVVLILVTRTKPTDDEDEDNGKKNKKDKEPTEQTTPTEGTGEKDKGPLKTKLEVDQQTVERVSQIWEKMKDSSLSYADAAQLHKDIVLMEKGKGISALIKMAEDALGSDDKKAQSLILKAGELTKKDAFTFESVKKVRNPSEKLKLAIEKLKTWWINRDRDQSYTFPPPALIEEFDKVIGGGSSGGGGSSASGSGQFSMKEAFKSLIKEELRPGVQQVLNKVKDEEMTYADGVTRLKELGKADVVPILITELANDDTGFIGQTAHELLIKITERTDALNYNGMMKDQRFSTAQDWQDWWLSHK